ncbi:MAG: peptidoglycan recognition family protein [Actinomycetota bacterium]
MSPANAPEPSQLPPDVPAPPDSPDLPEEPPAPALPGKNNWRYIVIHHSASPSGNAAAFDRAHRGKGWDGLAYHFVITNGKGGADGGLEVSPRWWVQKHGAHAGAMPTDAPPESRNGYNEFGIGICLVGNFEKRPPSKAQMKTLAALITRLRGMFDIPTESVVGHRHVKSTACPGSRFPWRTLFQLTGDTHPQHLYKRPLAATYERCPWCDQRETVAFNRRKEEPAAALPPRTGAYISQ